MLLLLFVFLIGDEINCQKYINNILLKLSYRVTFKFIPHAIKFIIIIIVIIIIIIVIIIIIIIINRIKKYCDYALPQNSLEVPAFSIQ